MGPRLWLDLETTWPPSTTSWWRRPDSATIWRSPVSPLTEESTSPHRASPSTSTTTPRSNAQGDRHQVRFQGPSQEGGGHPLQLQQRDGHSHMQGLPLRDDWQEEERHLQP